METEATDHAIWPSPAPAGDGAVRTIEGGVNEAGPGGAPKSLDLLKAHASREYVRFTTERLLLCAYESASTLQAEALTKHHTSEQKRGLACGCDSSHKCA
jgi:hypothetical protein